MSEAAPDPEGGAEADEPTAEAGGSQSPEPTGSGDVDRPVAADVSVEALLDDVERLTGERDAAARQSDQYLDSLARAQADFENFRKRTQRQQADQAEAVAARLVEGLLPVLDACDAAVAHGAAEVEPIFAALLQTLERDGLERIDPLSDVFDPTRHEAVMHEPAAEDDDPALAVVVDVMRRGYGWKGRVLRPAMVKVRG